MTAAKIIPAMQIEQAIFLIRGQRVMFDRDLAAMYDVTTGNLNKAVRRNLSRFPADFMFQLTSAITSPDNFSILVAVTDSMLFAVRRTITQPIAWLKTRRTIPPLLPSPLRFDAITRMNRAVAQRRRVGVRADVFPDFMVAPQEVLQRCRAHSAISPKQ